MQVFRRDRSWVRFIFLCTTMIVQSINIIYAVVRLFADDTSMLCAFLRGDFDMTWLNSDLQSLVEWANQWAVLFNAGKTKGLTISRSHNDFRPPLEMDGVGVDEVDAHKHLGIYFNTQAKWNEQIDEIVKKAGHLHY